MCCAGKLPQGSSFDHEAAELRQEALLAEQRCALQSGEAGALAAAAATYERQSARLQDDPVRCCIAVLREVCTIGDVLGD